MPDVAKASETGTNATASASGGVDWNDPSVPAGDSPPLPRWPLIVSVVAFVLWIVFLLAMTVIRTRTTPN